ncbi:DUF5684 domain-containing protein [Streptococcus sp. 2018037]|uniref:Membrane protein n=1 Tax=Streptococcus suis TaxID=1307 RepID=A0A116QJV6_STRSU|nr:MULTISPECIES: DUF5684 domain-containing protein [Streptococcus]MBM7266861.1 hypothetical protein [Streptococcus suis]MBY0752085.1 DUF5684 domain-containing protein [Streptococcus sp. 2018037]NQL17692.1 hypothetical protein [Streptococcus suis]NQN60228.1 hypothetical protein [Streptococcus suis]NQP75001.1 hypothetical protein [Streptococcus suis]
MTEETLAQVILIGIWGTTLLFSFIWYILVAISNYILFKKAGYAGWKSLIPIYNLYIQQCIAFGYEKRWFILFLLIPLAGPLYGIYLVYNFGRSFGLSAVQAIFYVLLTPIFNLYIAFNDGSRYQGPQEFFID